MSFLIYSFQKLQKCLQNQQIYQIRIETRITLKYEITFETNNQEASSSFDLFILGKKQITRNSQLRAMLV